jgi:hypothetical protein
VSVEAANARLSSLATQLARAFPDANKLVLALPLVILAALVPALRATRVDPMVALREP